MAKNCKICGKEFTPRYNQQRCCSKECSHENKLRLLKEYHKKHYRYRYTTRKLGVKICANCGKEFQPAHNSKKYCSEICSREKERQQDRARRAKNRKPKLQKNCIVCGKEFTARDSRQKCCCAECGYKHYKAHKLKTYKKREPKLKKICANCGKEFLLKKANQKYCCRECYYKVNKLKPAIKKICPVCGSEFETARPIQKYCSKDCYIAYHKVSRRKSPEEKKKSGKKPLATNYRQERKKILKPTLNKTSTREKKPPKNQAATITSDKVPPVFELNDAQRAQRDRLKEILLQRREQREIMTQAEMYETEFAEMCRAEHLW